MSQTDRFEKQTHLRAPLSRVWRALSDAEEFGEWFGVRLTGGFAVGETVTGKLTVPGFEQLTFALVVTQMEPERLFAFRWHPYAIDPAVDYSAEPMTLVTFTLEEESDGGTRLTIAESGFDQLPASRRDEAFRMNERGWTVQAENIRGHVGG